MSQKRAIISRKISFTLVGKNKYSSRQFVECVK